MTAKQAVGWGAGEEECLRARVGVSLALDGQATRPDMYLTALHLGRCDTCREFAARIGAITTHLRALRGELRARMAVEDTRGAG